MRSLCLLTLLLIVGCSSSNSSSPTTDNKTPGTDNDPKAKVTGNGDTKPTVNTPPKVDFQMTASEWYAEYTKDKIAAKAKYNGKVIELTGDVLMVMFDSERKQTVISLKVENSTTGMLCYALNRDVWQTICEGSQGVKLRGQFAADTLAFGQLASCELLDAGTSVAGKFTALELCEKYQADRKALEQAWDGKRAYVEGEILKVEPGNGTWTIQLKGNEKNHVKCSFDFDPKEFGITPTEGGKLKVLGYMELFDATTGPKLTQCLATLMK